MAMKTAVRGAGFAVAAGVAMMMTGCAGMSTVTTAKSTVAATALHGHVHGGQQAISGAQMHFYAAGTSGYGATNTDLMTSVVLTDANGGFDLTGKRGTCTAGQQMYIVATGGNPGGGTNAQQASMAALGDCANPGSIPNISMNEVTTVAAVYALAPFMGNGYASIGSSAANATGLAQAFALTNQLVGLTNGAAPGPALPSGATAPTAEINTLADVVAACINTTGGTNTGTTCGDLFAYATPSGGTAPTDTISLALAIARNPTLNVSSINNYATPLSPFQPKLASTPTDFTMSINYTTGFSTPQSTTVDANGRIYVANAGSNSVTVLNNTGSAAATFSGNGLTTPAAVAIDASGNAWVANKGGTTVSGFSPSGITLSSSPYTVGSAPASLAFDAAGNVWVANSGSSSVSELSGSGTALQTLSTGSAPGAIAINPK